MQIQPDIIFEDDSLLVINKPAGLTVNDSDTTKGEETVQKWVRNYLKLSETSGLIQEESDIDDIFNNSNAFRERAGIAHRLDKETSGILLVAKTKDSFLELLRQFKQRLVKKTYIALVHGKVVPEEGIINVPVGRLPWNRKQFGVVVGGKEAVTKYKVLNNMYFISGNKKEILTLLELNPETGRTHQIRVHLKYIYHPIFGDEVYAGRKTSRNDRKLLSRVFLHAAKISFLHPKTGKTVSFEAVLPEELSSVIANCEKLN